MKGKLRIRQTKSERASYVWSNNKCKKSTRSSTASYKRRDDTSEWEDNILKQLQQLQYRTLVRLPVHYIQREADRQFVDGVREQELKQHLLMVGVRSLNEALDQAMKLEAASAAAAPPARLPGETRAARERGHYQPSAARMGA